MNFLERLKIRALPVYHDEHNEKYLAYYTERWFWQPEKDVDEPANSGIEWWAWALAIVAFVVIFFGLPILMTLSGFGGAVFGMVVWTIRMITVFIGPIMIVVTLFNAVFRSHEFGWFKFWLGVWVVSFVLLILTIGVS